MLPTASVCRVSAHLSHGMKATAPHVVPPALRGGDSVLIGEVPEVQRSSQGPLSARRWGLDLDSQGNLCPKSGVISLVMSKRSQQNN